MKRHRHLRGNGHGEVDAGLVHLVGLLSLNASGHACMYVPTIICNNATKDLEMASAGAVAGNTTC